MKKENDKCVELYESSRITADNLNEAMCAFARFLKDKDVERKHKQLLLLEEQIGQDKDRLVACLDEHNIDNAVDLLDIIRAKCNAWHDVAFFLLTHYRNKKFKNTHVIEENLEKILNLRKELFNLKNQLTGDHYDIR